MVEESYMTWSKDQNPENMGRLLRDLDPIITSEASRYSGPSHLLRNRARILALKAVRTYKPDQGAKLTSWVVTQMQPLSRYGKKMKRPVNTSELAYNQFAEMEQKKKEFEYIHGRDPEPYELSDMMGVSQARIKKVRAMVPSFINTGAAESTSGEEGAEGFSSLGVSSFGEDADMKTAVEAVYASLPEPDRIVFNMKTGYDGSRVYSNKAIAKRLKVSEALVSQRTSKIAKTIQENYGRV